jgi:uncharacterized protein (DUF1330 family)
MNVENAVIPSGDQIREFFTVDTDRPFSMLNLLRFKPTATYADGREPELSGREAYMRYGVGVAALIQEFGGQIAFSGDVTGLLLGAVDDMWDMVAIADYPSHAKFMEMMQDPRWLEIEVDREAGLAGQLNIRVERNV